MRRVWFHSWALTAAAHSVLLGALADGLRFVTYVHTEIFPEPPPYVLCTLRQRILCIHLFIYIYMYIYIFSMSLGALTDGLRFVTDLHNEIYPELLFVFVRCGSIYCVYVYLFKYVCMYIFSMLLGALTDGLRFVTDLHTEIYPELLFVFVRCGSIYCVYVYLFTYICIYIFSMLLGALNDGLRCVTDLHTEIYPELLFVFVRCGSIYCVYVYLFKYICIYIFSMLLGALTDGLRFVTV